MAPVLACGRDGQRGTELDVLCAAASPHNTSASSARGPLWVHFQGGYRASIAGSLTHAVGRAVTAADDDFSGAAAEGLALTGSRVTGPLVRWR